MLKVTRKEGRMFVEKVKRCKRCHKPLTRTAKGKYMCCEHDCPSVTGGTE